MATAQAPPAPPPATPPALAQPPAVQDPASSAHSVSAAVPQPPLHVFIPANTPLDAPPSASVVQNPAGFHWHVIATSITNTVFRDIAARRRLVEGLPTFSNASFRSHVRYIIMDVMIAAFTRSCSTLRPQARENTDPTFIFIPTAHFLFLLLRECVLASASPCIGRAAQRYFAVLLDFQSLNMHHLL